MTHEKATEQDMGVSEAEVEAAAKALVTAKGTNPMTLFQFNVFTGNEPFDHEDDTGRRYIYSWRKQMDNARAALLAAALARTAKPAPEWQGMEPVPWRFTTADINGDFWPWDFTGNKSIMEQKWERGLVVEPLYALPSTPKDTAK